MKGFILVLFTLAALPAAAQTVTFRSGEHERFSRLVLDIPPGQAWALGRFGPDYVLDLGEGVSFDLAEAFARIPRDRIATLDVTEEEGRLILRLGCSDCHATGFLFTVDKLVIDVADGPPPPDSPFETAFGGTALQDPAGPRIADGQIPLFGSTGATSDLLFDPAPTLEEGGPTPAVPGFETLAADMARAVAAGILDAPEFTPAAITIPEQATLPPLVISPDPEPSPQGPGISFITADMPRIVPGPRALSRSGHACRSDAEVDLAAWGPIGDFSRDIGALRSGIVDAAGAVDDVAVQALARGYLHYAFGAEARRTLAIGDTDSTDARFLALLADIIDGRPARNGMLADQTGCLGAIALWSALADGSIDGRTAAERTAIEVALRILPPAPRRALVPRMAGMFLAGGQPDTATALLALIPADAATEEEIVVLRSDIARAGETAAAATAARAELLAGIENGSRMGAGTMVRLVESTLATGQTVEPWMTETLATLRFEQRDGPMAGPLAATEIRALTAQGKIEAATLMLADVDVPLAPAERETLADTLAAKVTETADDAAFLAFAFAEAPLPLSAAGTNAVAGRLIALGFPDVALERLATPAPTDAMRDRRLLRASALRDLGQSEEATLLLAGIAEAEPEAPDPGNAWRAGNWEDLRDSDDPLLAAAAEARLTGEPAPADPASLADRAALVAAAEETRALAQGLLDRFPTPAAEAAP